MEERKTFSFTAELEDLNLSVQPDVLSDDDSVESLTLRPPSSRRSARLSGMSDDEEDLFVSPKSHLSTESSVGGGSTTTRRVKLLYVKDSQMYCAGKVGANTNQACIKIGCTTKGHQLAENKLVLHSESLYINRTKLTVLCQPSLQKEMVPTKQWDQLQKEKKTILMWKVEMRITCSV